MRGLNVCGGYRSVRLLVQDCDRVPVGIYQCDSAIESGCGAEVHGYHMDLSKMCVSVSSRHSTQLGQGDESMRPIVAYCLIERYEMSSRSHSLNMLLGYRMSLMNNRRSAVPANTYQVTCACNRLVIPMHRLCGRTATGFGAGRGPWYGLS